MKKIPFLAVAALMLGSAAAYEFDLNTVQPGILMSSAADGARARLFPDQKPAAQGPFRLSSKHPLNGVVEVSSDHELVFKPVPGGKDGLIIIRTGVPKLKKLRVSFKVKGEEFFAKGRSYNIMTIALGGAGIQVRGNTFDIRYLDGGTKPRAKYLPLTKMQDNVWQEVVLELSCGDAPTYSINDKKDVVQRGKVQQIRSVGFNVSFKQVKSGTCVKIKDLKIAELK